MNAIKNYYSTHPLRFILFSAFVIRFVAAIFSKGYGMWDDHFLIIEASQSFVDGFDYNNWLPKNTDHPSGHNFFYTGIHYLIFLFFKTIGFNDPQNKMLAIRFLHAIYSLLVVFLGFKISRRITTEQNALRTAWVLALLWFVPNYSVRNLIEFVCIPPLLAASLCLLKYEELRFKKFAVYAGILLGLAMGIRYQCMFFVAGTGLFFLIRKDIQSAILFSLTFSFVFFATQSTDLFLWGRPFAEIQEYFSYNAENATSYFDSPWYNYILTLGGMLIPPLSLLLLAGYFKNYKKYFVLFLPSFCFLVFHSFFPNKQERFILPFVPYLIICGIAGWSEFRKNIFFEKLTTFSWKFFWIINTILVLAFSTFYSKRAYVEAMYFLYSQNDFKKAHFDCSLGRSMYWPPLFYCGKWDALTYSYGDNTDMIKNNVTLTYSKSPENYPQYALFVNQDNIEERTKLFEVLSKKNLELKAVCEPGFIDRFLHWLNHHNKSDKVFVYKIL